MGLKVRFTVAPVDQGPDIRPFAVACEDLGFDTIWLSDVPLAPGGDPLVSLASAASVTSKLKLGTNLVPLGRNPMILARQLAQLDQLTDGRLLLTLVPGVAQPGEREALGYPTGDRGVVMEEMVDLLRRWWSGETVTHHSDLFDFTEIRVGTAPVQDPLEIWFGGTGPRALERAGRLGDGWLTASLRPDEAAAGRRTIEESAAAAGRVVDPEHFGISMPFAREHIPDATLEAMKRRRPDRSLDGIIPVGAAELEDTVRAHVDGGLSKFVVRQVDPTDLRDDLEWLAGVILPLQT